jgi:DNA topoisomerase-1
MWLGGGLLTPLDGVLRALPVSWRQHFSCSWSYRRSLQTSGGHGPRKLLAKPVSTSGRRRRVDLGRWQASISPENGKEEPKENGNERATRAARRKTGEQKSSRGVRGRSTVSKAERIAPQLDSNNETSPEGSAARQNRKALVIVESPAKARTIQKFLPGHFVVESCMGHIRDLPQSARQVPAELKEQPWARLGVDVADSFRPLYVVPENRQETVDRLREQLATADELVLATDEDREGEAISWHLVELLRPQVPVRRAVFHEITEDAIQEAFQNFREIDMNLVHAQETRRILDRLAGYTLSPLLWKKIAPGLSAGRVQSVALAMIVERELERLRFRSARYWSILARLRLERSHSSDSATLLAELVRIGEARLATGKDFDAHTGQLKAEVQSASSAGRVKVIWLDEPTASRLAAEAQSAPPGSFRVVSIERRQVTRTPPLAFTTSTLQQEASRRLRISTLQVMRAAQSLYEAGYITYMRTDSPVLSSQAVKAARQAAAERFGAEHAQPDAAPPRKITKKPKGAQEAHEAIRPAGRSFPAPSSLTLERLEMRLYELIYFRTLASEMQPAKLTQTTLTIHGPGELIFRASGSQVDFPGWLLAYEALQQATISAAENTASSTSSENEETPPDEQGLLPRNLHLSEGDRLSATAVDPMMHETKAPARYTEASLVKELEANGVGRPSTYVSIIETLLERSYVVRKGATGASSSLMPTLTAFVVVRFLQRHFPNFVDVRFTSEMEAVLDRIARGEADRIAYLQQYYCGHSGLAESVRSKSDTIDVNEARRVHLPSLETGNVSEKAEPAPVNGTIESTTTAPAEANQHAVPEVYVGPYGPYIVYGEKVSLPREISAEQVTLDNLRRLVEQRKRSAELGIDPDTGMRVYLRTGRYGPYVQLGEDPSTIASTSEAASETRENRDEIRPEASGSVAVDTASTRSRSVRRTRAASSGIQAVHQEKPKRMALPSWMDPASVDLNLALRLLSMPRIVGEHPGTGEMIRTGYGRLGPYLLYQGKYTSLSKYEAGGPTDPLFIDLETAVHILDSAKPSKSASLSAQSDGDSMEQLPSSSSETTSADLGASETPRSSRRRAAGSRPRKTAS